MNVINQPNQEIIERLGGIQIFVPGKEYRLNRYVYEERMNDRIILYNSFTNALIDMNEEEYNDCIKIAKDADYVSFFFRNYFVVPVDYDETEALRKLIEKKRVQIDENYLKYTKLYTILPTTGCNARCFYCYEKGTKTKVMTKEVAEKIATLIARRYKEQQSKFPDKNNRARLHWFGGEPTMNMDAIDLICNILSANGIPYDGDMISNGYLFNPENAKKARELWKITNVQITLDGTDETYNKTKAYVYKDDPNPFATVIGNIRNLISNGIRVTIRMNMDLYNAEDIKALIPYLRKEFGPEELISAYAYPIFEGHGIKRTEEHFKQTTDELEEIEDVLEKYGFIQPLGETKIPSHHCMADGGEGILFSPEGNIGLCEHYVDKEFIGNIDDPDNLDLDGIKKFWEREEDTDLCSDCLNYIDCIRLSMCEDLRNCTEHYKRWRNNQIRRRARVRVKQYYEEANKKECQRKNKNIESEILEIKESLRILHNKIDTIYNFLNNNRR